MAYEYRSFDAPSDFSSRVGGFLMAREGIHSLHIGILDRLLRRGETPVSSHPAPLLMSVESDGEVVGIAIRTPPHKLIISDLSPQAAASLADVLTPRCPDLPAVLGDRGAAQAFAEAWCARTGTEPRLFMENAIHRLDRLEPPEPVEGGSRRAAPADLDRLAGWYRAFEDEAHATIHTERKRIAEKIERGDLHLWCVDRKPVSMAGIAARTPNSGRVGPVYTPKAERGSGYGTAVTAAATASLLEEGKAFCVLYTDLANPTSNKIYRALGYRVIAEAVDIEFLPASKLVP